MNCYHALMLTALVVTVVGCTSSDPPVAARAIISMLTGVTAWFREGGRLSAAEIEDIYTQMVAQSVGRDRRQPCSTHP